MPQHRVLHLQRTCRRLANNQPQQPPQHHIGEEHEHPPDPTEHSSTGAIRVSAPHRPSLSHRFSLQGARASSANALAVIRGLSASLLISTRPPISKRHEPRSSVPRNVGISPQRPTPTRAPGSSSGPTAFPRVPRARVPKEPMRLRGSQAGWATALGRRHALTTLRRDGLPGPPTVRVSGLGRSSWSTITVAS
jgi:hypothetical protein